MKRNLSFVATLLATLVAGSAVFGDESQTKVKVALLDVSAMAGLTGAQTGGNGAWGQGMMGYGMMGGMMSGGMMSGGMMGRGMMSIRADQTTAKAGTVVFDVTNWSRSVVHEMVMVAVDSPDAPLPYDYNRWRVMEEQTKVIGESGELSPNTSHSVSLKLAAGSYLLI